jgi:hypothetical protein
MYNTKIVCTYHTPEVFLETDKITDDEKIKDQSYLKECITKVGDTYFSEDKEIGLMILFSYDYMYITHICISEYLETGTISDHNIETLNTLIHF